MFFLYFFQLAVVSTTIFHTAFSSDLEFMPIAPEGKGKRPLVWYKSSDPSNVKKWASTLDKSLEEYYRLQHENSEYCDYGRNLNSSKACYFNIKELVPCVREWQYNYPKGAPCVFLRLKKILGWKPEFYNHTNKLPRNMPRDLQFYIEKHQSNYQEKKLNTVWVSCEGENSIDIENMGPIQYLPTRGFPGFFFPFENQPGYLSPLVAIFFEEPTRGVLINIECRAWAPNIHHDRWEQRGVLTFQLMVD